MSKPGYLSIGPSNVGVSAGGDTDILSPWATSASSSWTSKKRLSVIENNTEISTGYVKNYPRIESPTGQNKEIYKSTYRDTHETSMALRGSPGEIGQELLLFDVPGARSRRLA